MGSQLWILQDVRNWLTELRGSEPGLARLTGEAVVALLDAGGILGPPLAIRLPSVDPTPRGARRDPADAREHDARQQARRDIANVSTSRKRVELTIAHLERQAVRLAGQIDEALKAGREDAAAEARIRETSIREQLAELRHNLLMLTAEEERATAVSQRLEAQASRPQTRD